MEGCSKKSEKNKENSDRKSVLSGDLRRVHNSTVLESVVALCAVEVGLASIFEMADRLGPVSFIFPIPFTFQGSFTVEPIVSDDVGGMTIIAKMH